MTVTVGCSGWSYEDWIGRFFPFDIRSDNAKLFEHYAQFFNTVEINSTFYRMPGEKQVSSWAGRARDHPGFEFSVKMPQSVSHRALVEGDDRAAVKHALFFEEICALPLKEAGGLGAILIQLSPFFQNQDGSFEVLSRFLGSLSVGEFHYAIEFRHHSWMDEGHRLREDVARLLRDNRIASVTVDGPGFPPTMELTADSANIRFHGRNFDIWFHDEKEEDDRLDRYDYLYSEDQLRSWLPRIREMESIVPRVRVFFNNHGRAKSARNALELMDLLSIPHREKVVHVADQAKIDAF